MQNLEQQVETSQLKFNEHEAHQIKSFNFQLSSQSISVKQQQEQNRKSVTAAGLEERW